MQNSACFIGKPHSAEHERRIKDFIQHLTSKYRVKVFYLSSRQNEIYNILNDVRKFKKIFSRVFVSIKSTIECEKREELYSRYEDFVLPSHNLTTKEVLQKIIALSTYVIFLTNKKLSEEEKKLYLLSKEYGKQIFVLT